MKDKTVNLTIRVSRELKQQAEQSALLLDLTLSQVIRKALNQLVDDGENHVKHVAFIHQNRRKALHELEQENAYLAERGVAPMRALTDQEATLSVIGEMQRSGIIDSNKAAWMRAHVVQVQRQSAMQSEQDLRESLKEVGYE
jgi:antitoxin component of RelBE/YafQ-DinJ toxin-antitoxin module